MLKSLPTSWSVICCSLCSLCWCLASQGILDAATVLIDSDYAAAPPMTATVGAQPGRVTGGPGMGWRDNSDWAKVWVTYTTPVITGRRCLRVQVDRMEDGRCQWLHDLPLPEGPRYYRLTFTARCDDAMGLPIGIRLLPAPYTWLWSTMPVLSEAWKDFHYVFRIGPDAVPICLMMGIEGVGSAEIANIRLEEVTTADIATDRAASGDASVVNLVGASRFPLGLPSGWALDRENGAVQAASDPGVVGPGGCPTLRCDCPTPATIYAAPFPIYRVDSPHTASLSIRGDYQGELAAVCDHEVLATTAIACSTGDGWKRVSLTFRPNPLGRFHGLRLTGHGHLWIDALQVEAGDHATPYASQAPCEVALACSGPVADARVLFDDQPATVDYVVTGAPAGVALAGVVVNAYGQRHPLVTTPLGPDRAGSLAVDVFPRHPFGEVRLDAWVLDRQGRRISPKTECVVMRIRRPRAWGEDAPWSAIGVHTNATAAQLDMAKAIGANWVRLHDAGTQYIGWAQIEADKGQWRFRDAAIQRYRSHHLEILGLLSTAPDWATALGPGHRGYFEQYCQPKDLEAWSTYVTTVVKRYRGVIGTYEIWNEPWGNEFWHLTINYQGKDQGARYVSGPNPAAAYARLMALTYRTAKAADPKISIVGISGSAGQRNWGYGVVEAGGLDACDVASYHQYTGDPLGRPDDSIHQGYDEAMQAVFRNPAGKTKPIWLSEGSPETGSVANGLYLHTLPVEDTDDGLGLGDRIGRFVAGLLSLGVRKVFLYSMHSHSYFGEAPDWRILVCEDGYLHPSAAALSTVSWYIDGLAPAGAVDPAPGIHVMVFQGRDRTVGVVCPISGTTGYHLPKGGDALWVDVFGNPLPPGGVLGRTLAYVSVPGDTMAARAQLIRDLGGK